MNEEMNEGTKTEAVGGGEPVPAGTVEVKETIDLASRWKRLGGALIDGILSIIIVLSIMSTLGLMKGVNAQLAEAGINAREILAKGFKIEHSLCAAEDKLPSDAKTFLRLMLEALYINWYYVGKVFSHVTGFKHMLDRIS